MEEVPGQGIRGIVGGHRVAVGKAAWAGVTGSPRWAKTARRRARLDGALTVFVAADGQPAGVLVLDDPVRPDAGRTIRALRRGGINRIVMVTGDRAEVAETVGAVIGVDEVLAERTPAEKLDAVRVEHAPGADDHGRRRHQRRARAGAGRRGCGHGRPRAPPPRREAADAVLTVDRLDRLGEVTALARRTQRIARQSVLAGMAMSLAAMGAAAAGLLPAVWGALLQELIDVAVILNALRALQPGRRPAPAWPPRTRRSPGASRPSMSPSGPASSQLRAAADALGLQPARRGHGPGPHGPPAAHRADRAARAGRGSSELYPALDRLLGGTDPTATMSRAHAEIAHQIRRLGQLLDDIGAGPPDDVDVADLRSLLYGLHAILRLHTAQEDESYLSLGDDQQAPPPASPQPATLTIQPAGPR